MKILSFGMPSLWVSAEKNGRFDSRICWTQTTIVCAGCPGGRDARVSISLYKCSKRTSGCWILYMVFIFFSPIKVDGKVTLLLCNHKGILFQIMSFDSKSARSARSIMPINIGRVKTVLPNSGKINALPNIIMMEIKPVLMAVC